MIFPILRGIGPDGSLICRNNGFSILPGRCSTPAGKALRPGQDRAGPPLLLIRRTRPTPGDAALIRHQLPVQTLAGQQQVELLAGIAISRRRADRNRKAFFGKLAGQYDRDDGAGTDLIQTVIVFYRFDYECH